MNIKEFIQIDKQRILNSSDAANYLKDMITKDDLISLVIKKKVEYIYFKSDYYFRISYLNSLMLNLLNEKLNRIEFLSAKKEKSPEERMELGSLIKEMVQQRRRRLNILKEKKSYSKAINEFLSAKSLERWKSKQRHLNDLYNILYKNIKY